MPLNGNSDITKEYQDTFKIQSVEGTLLNIGTSVNPVFDVRRKFTDILAAAGQNTTGTYTCYTTIARDFYLNYLTYTVSKDATSDCIKSTVTAIIGGATTNLHTIDLQTTTAGSFVVTVNFPFPIKIDKSTAIRQTGAFTVGATVRSITVAGFYI